MRRHSPRGIGEKSHAPYPYQAYLITLATRHGYPFFSDHGRARLVARAIADLQHLGACHNWCYVLMPDHCQWMLSLKEKYSLQQAVGMLKGNTSRLAGVSLWQKGFQDHALRHERDLLPTARHVVANPLRAGLVEKVGDYPYWNAVWL